MAAVLDLGFASRATNSLVSVPLFDIHQCPMGCRNQAEPVKCDDWHIMMLLRGLDDDDAGVIPMQELTLLHTARRIAEAAAALTSRVLAAEKRNLNALYFLAADRCQQGRLDDGMRSPTRR